MNIPYKFRSLTFKVLSEAEIAAVRDVPVKEFIVQQDAVKGFISSATDKAKSSFPWMQAAMIQKLQAALPFILSWLSPGETVRFLAQLEIQVAGFPIVSRSVFIVKVVK